jgi:REP element-mobilizing transposase RayT
MPRIKHHSQRGSTYHLTTRTRAQEFFFAGSEAKQIVIDALRFYRNRGDFLLHAYVIMDNHWHLAITPMGNKSISGIMANLKRWVSRRISELASAAGKDFRRAKSKGHFCRARSSIARPRRLNLAIRPRQDGIPTAPNVRRSRGRNPFRPRISRKVGGGKGFPPRKIFAARPRRASFVSVPPARGGQALPLAVNTFRRLEALPAVLPSSRESPR